MQRPDPDVPIPHCRVVILKRETPLLRRVVERDGMVGHHAIGHHRHHGRQFPLAVFDDRALQDDVIGLPTSLTEMALFVRVGDT